MKKFWIVLALGATLPMAHAASLTKAGLYEVHIIKQVMDGKDMAAQMAAAQAGMQEQLAKMSPAERQQMEQMLGGQKMPGVGDMRICISAEMAAQDKPVMPSGSECEPTKYDRSGNKVSFEFNCTRDGHSTVGTGESVMNGDTVTSRMDMVMTDARGRHTMQSESQMKYLGADCQGVKPMEQVMKSLGSSLRPK